MSYAEKEQLQKKIDAFLSQPIEVPTREDAMRHLIDCGILNNDGTVAKPYQGIVVKK